MHLGRDPGHFFKDKLQGINGSQKIRHDLMGNQSRQG